MKWLKTLFTKEPRQFDIIYDDLRSTVNAGPLTNEFFAKLDLLLILANNKSDTAKIELLITQIELVIVTLRSKRASKESQHNES